MNQTSEGNSVYVNAPMLGLIPKIIAAMTPDNVPQPTKIIRPGDINMRLATANIGRAKSMSVRRQNIDNIAHHTTNAIVGFQEIDEGDTGDEHAAVTAAFGHTHHMIGMGTHTPIMIPLRYRVVSHDVHQISAAGTSVGARNQTPPRYAVSTVVQPEGKPELRFVVLNSHAPRKVPILNSLRADWEHGMNKAIAKYNKSGYNVFLTNDPNDTPHLQGINYVVDLNVDRIGFTHGMLDVTVKERNVIPMTIEPMHDCHLVVFKIATKAKAHG